MIRKHIVFTDSVQGVGFRCETFIIRQTTASNRNDGEKNGKNRTYFFL